MFLKGRSKRSCCTPCLSPIPFGGPGGTDSNLWGGFCRQTHSHKNTDPKIGPGAQQKTTKHPDNSQKLRDPAPTSGGLVLYQSLAVHAFQNCEPQAADTRLHHNFVNWVAVDTTCLAMCSSPRPPASGRPSSPNSLDNRRFSSSRDQVLVRDSWSPDLGT